MRVHIAGVVPAALLLLPWVGFAASAGFTLEQIRANPFPNELTAAAAGSRIAWAFNERGERNVWVAEGPDFKPRKLTNYPGDDGQELTGIAISNDGEYVVYVRGGDHGANWEDRVPVNPTSATAALHVQIWSVPFVGGEPKLLGDGDLPAISPRGNRVAFERDNAIWTVPIDGASAATRLFSARGVSESPQWSPDGSRLAFTSNRGTHSFIGVFTVESSPILWMAPSTSRDAWARWSPDGRQLAFVRRQGTGGEPEPLLQRRPVPWSIWTADSTTGQGRQLRKIPPTLRGSIPTTHGGPNLTWAAGNRIVFLSYEDGWPHLYSMPADGGSPLLLTPGNYMLEHIAISPSLTYLVASANTGSQANDLHRRHIIKIPVDRAAPAVLTEGDGLEWTPVVTGDGRSIAYIGATAQNPPLPHVMDVSGANRRSLGSERIPAEFPARQLVTPRPVQFKAPDGMTVHGQLFENPGTSGKKPAIVYVHGGPPRQMLLGWNYSDYYSNAYAVNQYLASRGYVVLAVNYRLGIGYGFDFHQPANGGTQGASEYQDIRAAGEYLRGLPNVDTKRIGIYGGSYGGFLTAMALARDSAIFAAGVDIHGVHDRTLNALAIQARYEKPADFEQARTVAWKSSPIAYVGTWKSPVLLIHGDDDRNVAFAQTVDLVQRLRKAGVDYEEIVIPDDTHHFMRNANWLTIDSAIASFFDRKLR